MALLPLVQGHLGAKHAHHDQHKRVEGLPLFLCAHFVHAVDVVAVADEDHLLLVRHGMLAASGHRSGALPGRISRMLRVDVPNPVRAVGVGHQRRRRDDINCDCRFRLTARGARLYLGGDAPGRCQRQDDRQGAAHPPEKVGTGETASQLFPVHRAPMADDLVDQQLTDTLQQLDYNFAQAHDAAAKLLVQVKAYAQRVRRVHAAAAVRPPPSPPPAVAASHLAHDRWPQPLGAAAARLRGAAL